jgi:hypothetical protein
MILALICAAVAVFLFPLPANGSSRVFKGFRDLFKTGSADSFGASIGQLSRVRARLAATNALTEKEKTAIETLTLALVAGSEIP